MSKSPVAPRETGRVEQLRWSEFMHKHVEHLGDMDSVVATTTSVATKSIWKLEIPDESAFWIEAFVLGKKADSSDRAGYLRRILVYRDGAGATIQGTESSVETIESNASWNVGFSVSGNDVQLDVLGVAGTDIDWRASLRYLEVR